MFYKQLFKLEADTGSNGSSVDNTSQNQQEAPNSEQQNNNADVNVENLSEEQIQALAEKHGFITSDKLDQIIENRQKRWEKDKEKEVERSKLSVKEQLALELEEIQEENKRLKLEKQQGLLKDSLKVDFSKSDIPYNDDVLSLLVATDEEETQKRANAFKDYVANIKSSIEEEVRKELRSGGYQTFINGKNTGSITKQDILNIKDDIKRQQAMAENMHLFN